MIDISVWLTIIFRSLAAKLITMKAKFYILTKIEFIVYWELFNHSTVLSTMHLIRHHGRIWFWYSIDKLKIINSPVFLCYCKITTCQIMPFIQNTKNHQCAQGLLNSIIDPGQSSALGPLPTQPFTGIKM